MPPNGYQNGSIKMTYGIRISDKENGVVSVYLPEILNEILNGNNFYWSILFLSCTGNLGEERSVPVFEDQIRKTEKGFSLSWTELNVLAKKFFQIKDITLIGCVGENLIRHYNNDEEMHENCDIVIEMIDCNFWEVFSKDKSLIERLLKKFKNTEWLTKNKGS